jgi:hypothetical protein
MNRAALLVFCGFASAMPFVHADESAVMSILRAGCSEDVQKLCAGVQPGGGRVLACLKEHKEALSDKCKQAAQQAAAISAGHQAPAQPSSPPPSAPPSSRASPVLVPGPEALS